MENNNAPEAEVDQKTAESTEKFWLPALPNRQLGIRLGKEILPRFIDFLKKAKFPNAQAYVEHSMSDEKLVITPPESDTAKKEFESVVEGYKNKVERLQLDLKKAEDRAELLQQNYEEQISKLQENQLPKGKILLSETENGMPEFIKAFHRRFEAEKSTSIEHFISQLHAYTKEHADSKRELL